MSAFIGPIHYWLYEKIRVVIQREEYIYKKAAGMCGSTAEETRDQVWQTYGKPLNNTELGEIIDHDNIHGWLQHQINIAESREAAFIKELLHTCGETAYDLIEQAFREHGKMCGEQAKAQGKYDPSTAPGIYKALRDYYLNGMPCDQADKIISSQPESVTWEAGACLQAPNWQRAGMDDKTMAAFYQTWLEAFVQGINADFAFKYSDPARTTADTMHRYEIYMKRLA